jgi:hypothetical protein
MTSREKKSLAREKLAKKILRTQMFYFPHNCARVPVHTMEELSCNDAPEPPK